jgi:hypothetical protein
MFYLRHKHDLRMKFGPLFLILEAALIIGFAGDVIYNWTFGVVLFMGVTKDWTLSGRLKRYRNEPKYAGTWRCQIASSICRELNKQDPDGSHC